MSYQTLKWDEKSSNTERLRNVYNFLDWLMYEMQEGRVQTMKIPMSIAFVKMAEKGIACNVHYKPLPMMTAYKKLGFDIANYKNAYNQFVNEITLPLHTRLTDEEVDYIINCYVELLKEYVK